MTENNFETRIGSSGTKSTYGYASRANPPSYLNDYPLTLKNYPALWLAIARHALNIVLNRFPISKPYTIIKGVPARLQTHIRTPHNSAQHHDDSNGGPRNGDWEASGRIPTRWDVCYATYWPYASFLHLFGLYCDLTTCFCAFVAFLRDARTQMVISARQSASHDRFLIQ